MTETQLHSHFKASIVLTIYELPPCEIWYLQEAQLSQRGRATLRAVENFPKLLKIMRNSEILNVMPLKACPWNLGHSRSLTAPFIRSILYAIVEYDVEKYRNLEI